MTEEEQQRTMLLRAAAASDAIAAERAARLIARRGIALALRRFAHRLAMALSRGDTRRTRA